MNNSYRNKRGNPKNRVYSTAIKRTIKPTNSATSDFYANAGQPSNLFNSSSGFAAEVKVVPPIRTIQSAVQERNLSTQQSSVRTAPAPESSVQIPVPNSSSLIVASSPSAVSNESSKSALLQKKLAALKTGELNPKAEEPQVEASSGPSEIVENNFGVETKPTILKRQASPIKLNSSRVESTQSTPLSVKPVFNLSPRMVEEKTEQSEVSDIATDKQVKVPVLSDFVKHLEDSNAKSTSSSATTSTDIHIVKPHVAPKVLTVKSPIVETIPPKDNTVKTIHIIKPAKEMKNQSPQKPIVSQKQQQQTAVTTILKPSTSQSLKRTTSETFSSPQVATNYTPVIKRLKSNTQQPSSEVNVGKSQQQLQTTVETVRPIGNKKKDNSINMVDQSFTASTVLPAAGANSTMLSETRNISAQARQLINLIHKYSSKIYPEPIRLTATFFQAMHKLIEDIKQSTEHSHQIIEEAKATLLYFRSVLPEEQ